MTWRPDCHKPLPIRGLNGIAEVLCIYCNIWFQVNFNIKRALANQTFKNSNYDLIVNLKNSFVSYKGRHIPTKPPYNLQNQHLFAFYILAKHAGSFLSTREIWELIEKEDMLKYLDGKHSTQDLAPESKYIRYGILKTIKKAFSDQPKNGFNHLIETQPTPKPARLRLNILPEKVLCIGLKEATSQ